jgi:hypothetical protein
MSQIGSPTGGPTHDASIHSLILLQMHLLMVALSEFLFYGESVDDLHTFLVKLLVRVLRPVLCQLLQLRLTLHHVLAPTPIGRVIVEVMKDRAS